MFYADYYYAGDPNNDSIVRSATRTQTNAKIVNQSFVFGDQYDFVDEDYDDYAALYNTLFCNGIYTDGNNDPNVTSLITSPASSYNGIAVGTLDDVNITSLSDGRSKPDIVAPSQGSLGVYSSYTTPIISGAATILAQSGARNDAGVGTASDATDIRTIKALLLNSATKPSGWSHTASRPLDSTNGAGIVNVNKAQLLLAAGQHAETVNDTLTAAGGSHEPPSGITDTVSSDEGWNLSTVTNVREQSQWRDATDHYFFNCDAAVASTFNLTATLVWNRNLGRSNINNLDLFLYTADGDLVASSISTVDNVEHLYELDLPPNHYVLQVYKPATGRDSDGETYALAFRFEAATPLAASNASSTTQSDSSILLNWSDNADNESGYRIDRRPSGGSYSTLTNLATNSESHTDTSCEPATTYDYRIIAYNEHGDAAAAETSATTYSVQENWRLLNFGSTEASGDAADNADPEFDGWVNLLEFATGSDPTTQSAHPVETSQLGASGQFSFTWRNNSGLDFSIGYSPELTTGFSYYSSSTIDGGASPKLELINSTPIDTELDRLTYGIRDSVSTDKAFIQIQINTP